MESASTSPQNTVLWTTSTKSNRAALICFSITELSRPDPSRVQLQIDTELMSVQDVLRSQCVQATVLSLVLCVLSNI